MTYLYVIRISSDVRKVGHSRDPKRRCGRLSWEFGKRCTLEYTAACPAGMVRAAEKHAHARLAAALIGGEMFRVDLETARAAVNSAVSPSA